MGRNLIVEVDETTYKRLEVLAQERNSKVENEIVEAIRVHIAQRINYIDDPFFHIGKDRKSR